MGGEGKGRVCGKAFCGMRVIMSGMKESLCDMADEDSLCIMSIALS